MRTGDWKYDIWINKKYFGIWSINHILAGCLLGALFFFIKLNLWTSLALSLIPILWWEIYERRRGVKETWQNGAVDVIISFVGFFVIWYTYPLMSTAIQVWIFIEILTLWIVLELWGYHAYKKLHKKKPRLPADR